jgi:4-amino-4-deoxy-L-arabinose transferase-like glycosyltransferase
MNRQNIKYYILAVLCVSLGLRLWGIDFSHSYHPDEPKKVEKALNLIQEDGVNLNPRYFEAPNFILYSSLSIYVAYYNIGRMTGRFKSLKEFKDYYEENPLIFFLLIRIYVVMASLATLLLAFFIGSRMYNMLTGCLAMLFLAVSPLHTIFSHYAKEDITVTLFIVISFLFSHYIIKKVSFKYYMLAGIFAGIALSNKWMALNCLWFITAAHIINYYRNRNVIKNKFIFHARLLLAVLSMLIGFLIFSPYVLIERTVFINDMHKVSGHAFGGRYGVTPFNPIMDYPLLALKLIWQTIFWRGLGFLIGMFSLAGAVYAAFKRTPEDLLVLSFIVPFTFMTWTNYNLSDRYYLPAIPFLVIIAARLILDVFNIIKTKFTKPRLAKPILGFFIFLVIVEPLTDTIRYDLSMRPDTRDAASAWIYENLPEGSLIAVEGISERVYMPYISRERYKVIDVDMLSNFPIEYYYENNVEYIIASSACYGRYLKEITPHRHDFYQHIFTHFPVVKEFSASYREYGFHNPKITILKMPMAEEH